MGFGLDRLGAGCPRSPSRRGFLPTPSSTRPTATPRRSARCVNVGVPGAPLTARDAEAADIAPALSLTQPRPPEHWPEVSPRPLPADHGTLIPLDAPLSTLAQALVLGVPRAGPATRPVRANHHRPHRPHRHPRAPRHPRRSRHVVLRGHRGPLIRSGAAPSWQTSGPLACTPERDTPP